MNPSVVASTETSEPRRLKMLLPEEWRSRVTIARSPEVNPPLITSVTIGDDRYAIQIDLIRWQSLEEDQRNLLFWHEFARIQAGTVKTFPWEWVAFSGGLAMSLVELMSQNLLLFAGALVVVGLSGNQLYQRHRGERGLREATAADQGAIALAMQAGYSFAESDRALREALQGLARQTTKKSQKNKYQARLQVLEICARNYQRNIQAHKQPLKLNKLSLRKQEQHWETEGDVYQNAYNRLAD
jgi:hypothetical protein